MRAGVGMRVVGGALVEDVNESKNNKSNEFIQKKKDSQDTIEYSSSGNNTTSGNQDDIDESGEDGIASEAGVREYLWQLSWSAVGLAIGFDEPSGTGSDLALHLCQQLRDLYCGGADGEFRYSQNVKSLLEMVMILARPRCGALLTGGSSGMNSSASGASKDYRSSRRVSSGDSQLQRGIMALLRDIRPADLVAFSCLVSALCELCFGIHYTRLDTNAIQGISSVNSNNMSNNSNLSIQIDLKSDNTSLVMLMPVEEKLRAEAGDYLIQLLDGSGSSNNNNTNNSSGQNNLGSTNTEKIPTVVIKGSTSMSVCLDVVSARFVVDLCEGLLSTRTASYSYNPSSPVTNHGPTNSTLEATETISSTTGRVGGFFESLGKMLSSSSMNAPTTATYSHESNLENVTERSRSMSSASTSGFVGSSGGKPLPSSALAKQGSSGALRVSGSGSGHHIMGMTLHRLEHISVPQQTQPPPESPTTSTSIRRGSELGEMNDRWISFPCSSVALRLFASTLRLCLSGLGPTISEHLWSQIILSVGCALSPWRLTEVIDSHVDILNDTAYFITGRSASISGSAMPMQVEDVPSSKPLAECIDILLSYCLTFKYVR